MRTLAFSNDAMDSNRRGHLLLITDNIHTYAPTGIRYMDHRRGERKGGREREKEAWDGMEGRKERREAERGREGNGRKGEKDQGRGGVLDRRKGGREGGGRKVGRTLENMGPLEAFTLSDPIKL